MSATRPSVTCLKGTYHSGVCLVCILKSRTRQAEHGHSRENMSLTSCGSEGNDSVFMVETGNDLDIFQGLQHLTDARPHP